MLLTAGAVKNNLQPTRPKFFLYTPVGFRLVQTRVDSKGRPCWRDLDCLPTGPKKMETGWLTPGKPPAQDAAVGMSSNQ